MNFTFGAPNSIAVGKWRRFLFHNLTLLVSRQLDEWRYISWTGVGPVELESDEGDNSALPADLDFIRWDCAANDQSLTLLPAYPDLPVIASPRGHISIPAGGAAEYILGIPAFIEIKAECEGVQTSLGSIASTILHKTWHGNQHHGTACYSLRTKARRSLDEAHTDAYATDIICQIQVRNECDEPTSFERLYLETGHHAIFEKDGQLWGNAARIRVDDPDENFTRITYSDQPLEPAKDATPLVPPRAGATRKSVLRQPFSSFFDVLSR